MSRPRFELALPESKSSYRYANLLHFHYKAIIKFVMKGKYDYEWRM
jgi:hypothetical protein